MNLSRGGIRTLRVFLLFAMVAAIRGQRVGEPYFALSSSRTFSGGRPSVSLSAWNVDSLEFRVYRIHDPVRFF